MPFKNRIRLPLEVKRPQFPTERTVFRLANGESKVKKAIVKKTYQGETDYMPERWHERAVIALNHDDVTIEGDKYLGGVALDSEYSIEWPEFFDYPTAKASFTAQVTPFNATNANCQTCEAASQLTLVDDIIPGAITEGEVVNFNIATNDNICCYPAVFSLITFDSTYIDSATIDADGLLTIIAGPSFPTSPIRSFLTYRVSCPDGSYDEAEVSSVFTGSLPEVCGEITNLAVNVVDGDAFVTFDEPTPNAEQYSWTVRDVLNLGVDVQTGIVTGGSFTIEDLPTGVEYRVMIRSHCYGAGVSGLVTKDFVIPEESGDSCGRYLGWWNGPNGLPNEFTDFNYTNCAGNSQNDIIFHGQQKTFCTLQSSPGNPYSIVGLSGYSYVELC
jgi:hypothetical protein